MRSAATAGGGGGGAGSAGREADPLAGATPARGQASGGAVFARPAEVRSEAARAEVRCRLWHPRPPAAAGAGGDRRGPRGGLAGGLSGLWRSGGGGSRRGAISDRDSAAADLP